MHKTTDYDEPTTRTYVDDVIKRTRCPRHHAESGKPCWVLIGHQTGETLRGVCNTRSRKAGFKGFISPESLRKSKNYKSQPRRKKFAA